MCTRENKKAATFAFAFILWVLNHNFFAISLFALVRSRILFADRI